MFGDKLRFGGLKNQHIKGKRVGSRNKTSTFF